MKNGLDVAKEWLGVLADIDRALDQKAKAKNVNEQDRLDKEIDTLETKMFEIKNTLKEIDVK